MTVARRLRLKPGWHAIATSPDDVEIRSTAATGESLLLGDDRRSGVLASILFRFEVGTTPAQFRRAFSAHRRLVAGLQATLEREGLLEAPPADPAAPTASAPTLADVRVALIGHGRLAADLTRLLRAEGARRLDRADTRVADAHLARMARVADVILLALEEPRPALQEAVHVNALRSATPWIPCLVEGHEGLVGPAFAPPATGCHACYQRRLRASSNDRPRLERLNVHLAAHGRRPPVAPRLPPSRIALLASLVAHEASRVATQAASPLWGGQLVVDLDDATVRREPFYRLPRCPDCGRGRAPPAQPYGPLSHLLDQAWAEEATPRRAQTRPRAARATRR